MNRCVVLVDNSNILIGGQKHSARVKGVTPERGREREEPSDPSWRIDFAGLLGTLARGRKIHAALLVGSTPPEADALWEAARHEGFRIILHERHHHGEKSVDTELVARGTEIIADAGEPMVLVLASGDQDYLPLVEVARRRNWEVELCAFNADFDPKGPLAQAADRVRPLDDIFDKIGFYEYPWPSERSGRGEE